MPGVLHWDHNHFVVLIRAGRSRLKLHDPAVGVSRIDVRAASRHFTGVALELAPTHNFRPRRPGRRMPLRRLLPATPGLKRTLTAIVALALVNDLYALPGPPARRWRQTS